MMRWMWMVPAVVSTLISVTPAAHATTYYISPTGSDTNSGTNGAPFKIFVHALPVLQPGDTLLLMDGIYDGTNSGYPVVRCGAGANNGTSTNPITVKAVNERQAWIRGCVRTRPPRK
jgi:hypothetical protein